MMERAMGSLEILSKVMDIIKREQQGKRSIRVQIAQSRAYSDKRLKCITYTSVDS